MEAAVWTLIAMQGATLFGLLYFVAGQLHQIKAGMLDLRGEMQDLGGQLRTEMHEMGGQLRTEMHEMGGRLERRIDASEHHLAARLDDHIERHLH